MLGTPRREEHRPEVASLLFPRRGNRVSPTKLCGVSGDKRRAKARACRGWLVLRCFPPIRIEETWRLWQKFLDDYSRFEDWLKSAERTAACPNSSEVLYTSAKEELKRFEVNAFSIPVS